MSDTRTGFVLGYHGCDAAVAEQIFAGAQMERSDKAYDWLGNGAYFWEGDPQRALEWALARERAKKIDKAAVIGAVIDLGNCLDLTKRSDCDLLADAYASLAEAFSTAKKALPENKDPRLATSGDKLLRYLDCAVIEHLHKNIEDDAREQIAKGLVPLVKSFDTVRGMFTEGDRLYPGGELFNLTHTQIAVRSDRSIVGFFRPRDLAPSTTSSTGGVSPVTP